MATTTKKWQLGGRYFFGLDFIQRRDIFSPDIPLHRRNRFTENHSKRKFLKFLKEELFGLKVGNTVGNKNQGDTVNPVTP